MTHSIPNECDPTCNNWRIDGHRYSNLVKTLLCVVHWVSHLQDRWHIDWMSEEISSNYSSYAMTRTLYVPMGMDQQKRRKRMLSHKLTICRDIIIITVALSWESMQGQDQRQCSDLPPLYAVLVLRTVFQSASNTITAVTDRKEWNFKDEKVQRHWQDNSTDKPDVPPRRHHNQWLVLWQTVRMHTPHHHTSSYWWHSTMWTHSHKDHRFHKLQISNNRHTENSLDGM